VPFLSILTHILRKEIFEFVCKNWAIIATLIPSWIGAITQMVTLMKLSKEKKN